MKPALAILAAGESRRLGECKALVRLTPATPLELLAAAGACFDEVRPLVISGADHTEIASRAPPPLEVAFNPRWRTGRTSSVVLARALRPGRDLCLAPVDVPLVPARVFERLLEAWLARGSPPRGWLAPCVRIRVPGEKSSDAAEPRWAHGHPIVAGRELLMELDHLDPGCPLADLRALAELLASIEVDAHEILDDLDTAADLARLRARYTT